MSTPWSPVRRHCSKIAPPQRALWSALLKLHPHLSHPFLFIISPGDRDYSPLSEILTTQPGCFLFPRAASSGALARIL